MAYGGLCEHHGPYYGDWCDKCGMPAELQNPTERAEATTTPEDRRGWDQPRHPELMGEGSPRQESGTGATTGGVRAEARQESSTAGGDPGSAPTAACGCDGSGKVHYVEHEDGPYRQIGPAIVHGSRLCSCRKDLEPRDGDATWWTSEKVYDESLTTSVFSYEATVTVTAEVPISEENYPLKRTGLNRYYPTTIDLDVEAPGGGFHWLFPDEARELARLLTEAADKADAIDKPGQCDECKCWAGMGDCPSCRTTRGDT